MLFHSTTNSLNPCSPENNVYRKTVPNIPIPNPPIIPFSIFLFSMGFNILCSTKAYILYIYASNMAIIINGINQIISFAPILLCPNLTINEGLLSNFDNSINTKKPAIVVTV